MKEISVELKAHIASEVTSLTSLWLLKRRDGVVMGFTDHDLDIIYESITYKAATGFTPTAVSASSNLSVDNLDIEGMLDSGALSEKDLMAGLYDYAEIEIFMLNYNDLTQGKMVLKTGWFGEVVIKNNQFTAEVRGITQRLSQNIGESYSPSCRANFADSKCGLLESSYSVSGCITGVSSRNIFIDTSRVEDDGTFSFGKIKFTSGENIGLEMEIKEFKNSQFILVLQMPYEVAVGDDYMVVQGCDKLISTCIKQFNNVLNFRGEPHIPGVDRIMETAGTRSNW